MPKPTKLLEKSLPWIESTPAAALLACLAWLYLVPAPVALLGGIGFAVLAWRHLDRSLCILPLTFPFWYVPKPLFGNAVFPLSEIALAISLMVALARGMTQLIAPIWNDRRAPAQGDETRNTHQKTAADLMSLVRRFWSSAREELAATMRTALAWLGPWLALGAGMLLLGGALGLLVARQPHDALRAFRWEILEPLVYLILVVVCVRQRSAARLLVWSFLASAALVATLAYLQVLWVHVTFTPLAQGNRLVRYVGASGGAGRATAIIYGSGNSLGAWLERALPLALALAVAARGWSRRERVLALACVLWLVPPLLWSDSRGAQVGAAVACALVLVSTAGLVRPAAALAGLAALIALWQRDAATRALLQGHHGTGQARLLVWLAALHMLRDHPVLGIGPDQFLYYYSSRYTRHPYWITRLNGKPTTLALDPTLSHPHDLPLELWLSTGIVGLAGFALILGNFWLRCVRLWRSGAAASLGRWPAALALGTGASVLASIVHGLVDSAYFEPDLALAFWMSVALLVLLERDEG
jgi:putative inorganic carbon (hco3(-)) transporter